MLELPSITPRIPVMAGEGKYFATPMEGGLRIAGTVELARLEVPPTVVRADALLVGAKCLLPELRHGKLERWMEHPSVAARFHAGYRALAANAECVFALGHGHVGLTAAAPTGEIIADIVSGGEPEIDISAFAAERF